MRQDWLNPATLRDATAVQRDMAASAEQLDRIGTVRLVAACDTSSKWRDTRGPVHAAVAPATWPDATALPAAAVTQTPPFPYVPGYLGFREAPAIVAAWSLLPQPPDLLLVDGQGRAHPRRCGIAVQLGLLLDVPTIGVAKSLLCGTVEDEPGPTAGDRAPVVDRGETVALALRTRARAAPIYVSGGHRVSLESAADWVLRLCDGRRLPWPIRLAHDAANARRRAYMDQVAETAAERPEH
ncbi:Endonuclease V [Sphingomonas jatrophae]|uniref:Endonuclease V n=2 Tax=Sphingomonas jatrophae TaxID=1166337 RepID=A0A1I6K825_9SPHN|nr:Endonuclease V [Sphingomonas jatrophae]